MVINGKHLLSLAPILNMEPEKKKTHGVSYGLGEVGYDVRINQTVRFRNGRVTVIDVDAQVEHHDGRFTLASTMEEFNMPPTIVGIVHDKSTWARQGLSVFNTVIEPGWKGFLTLELVFHGGEDLVIPRGAGIAQVVFHELSKAAYYSGKYQDQANEPVPSIFTKD